MALSGFGKFKFLFLCTFIVLGYAHQSAAVGEASTIFNVFVPPNNDNNGRYVALIVTAVSPNVTTTVDIIDDNADGDNDDTQLNVSLSRGQSYLLFPKDGAVNDDAGGKWDGDYFKIKSDYPVVVQVVTKSNWQHDWAPSDSGTQGSTGTSFFIFAPGTSGADNDINIYSYTNNNLVTVKKISSSTASVTSSGYASVDLSAAQSILTVTLSDGEDLVVRNNNLGLDILNPGETYWIQAQYPVSVQYGHLGQVSGGNQARDGGGFIPSNTGSASGDRYYFSIPHNPGLEKEKELRVIAYDDATTFKLYGFNTSSSNWDLIDSQTLNQHQTLDYVGNSNATFKGYDLYKAEASPSGNRVVLFEANWLETGASGTSDVASAVPSDTGGSGTNFISYLGPPGKQTNVAGVNATVTHLVAYSHEANTVVTFKDLGSNGGVVNTTVTLAADSFYDLKVTQTQYNSMNVPSSGKRPYVQVTSSKPIALVSENPNDNFMHYMTSPLPPNPKIAISSDNTVLTCGASLIATLTIDHSYDTPLDTVDAVMILPKGYSYVADSQVDESGSFSEPELENIDGGGQKISWSSVNMSGDYTLQIGVALNCSALEACDDGKLSSAVIIFSGTYGGEPIASQGSVSIETRRSSAISIHNLTATENSSSGNIDVAFNVPEGSSSVSYQITRATSPDGSETNLTTLASMGSGSKNYSYSDTGTGQATYFYRVNAIDSGACSYMTGPVTVSPESVNTSGEDAGLESKFSQAALERSIMRQYGGGYKIKTANDSLLSWLPVIGPGDTEGVDVSPHDLSQIANAEAVYSLDYKSGKDEVMATVLLVETVGAVYEHTKAICDRVKGGQVAALYDEPTMTGHVLRAQFTNDEHNIREFAMEFRLYENDDGSYDVHSKWVLSEYPDPAPGQRVLNFQIWSKVPGYDSALLSMILDDLEQEERLNFQSGSDANTSFISKMRVKGQSLEYVVSSSTATESSKMDVFLRVYVTEENGSVYSYDVTAASIKNGETGTAKLDRGHSYNIDLLQQSGDDLLLLDRVFVFDGGMTRVDDSYSNGSTTVSEYDLFGCAGKETEGTILAIGNEFKFNNDQALMYAGCGTYTAFIDQFGGLTRRFLGGYGALKVSSFGSVLFWMESSKVVNFCLSGGDKDVDRCILIAPQAEGSWLSFNLDSLSGGDVGVSGSGESEYTSAEFTTADAGEFSLTVRGLTFFEETFEHDGPFVPALPPVKVEKSTNKIIGNVISSGGGGGGGGSSGAGSVSSASSSEADNAASSSSKSSTKKSSSKKSRSKSSSADASISANAESSSGDKEPGFFGCSTHGNDSQPTGATLIMLLFMAAYLAKIKTRRSE